MIANYWLRPGNTASSSNCLSFLEDTLSRLRNKTAGLIRMDSGFFTKEILDHLEDRHLNYIIACRFNNRIKCSLTHEYAWVEVAEGLEISETTYKADSWDKPRRIVMVRQEIEKRPQAAGKRVRQLELFTSTSCRQTGQATGTFRGRERFWQIPLQLLCHQSQTARQDCVRFVSRKSGFRKQNQGIKV